MRRVLTGLVAMAMASQPIEGQGRPQSDSLPRDLVNALLGGSLGGRNVNVLAGVADDSLPPELFRDALLLGFADYRVTSTTVAYFPFAPQQTLDTIRARLVSAGWTAAPQETDTVRGFVTAYGGSRPQAICRGRLMVVPTVMVRSLNRTLAVISRQGVEMASVLCGGRDSRRERQFDPAADTPLPALPPPAGMQGRGGGSNGGGRDRGMTMTTALEGSTPLPDILSHYSELFTRGGWKKIEERTANTIAVITFEILSGGETWHCALVASIPAPDTADVFLSLRVR